MKTIFFTFFGALCWLSAVSFAAPSATSSFIQANPVSADTLHKPTGTPGKADSIKAAPSNALSDSAHKTIAADSSVKTGPDSAALKKTPGALVPAAVPPEDTLYHFWNKPYWAVGAGWGLGAFPLFTQWQAGVPDSAKDLIGTNSQIPKFAVTQAVDAYYIVWPILLSFTPVAGERSSLTVEGAGYFLFSSKSFIATLKNDSLPPQTATWNQSCAAYLGSIGLTYRQAVAEEYFKVEGVQQTSLLAGLSITPLLHVTKSASFSSSGLADSTRAVLQTHVDNRAWNGVGVGWKIGISTLTKLSSRSGLQMDLVYIGRYSGRFGDMRWKDINPSSDAPNGKVSFLSSTFEINVSLLTGKAPPKK